MFLLQENVLEIGIIGNKKFKTARNNNIFHLERVLANKNALTILTVLFKQFPFRSVPFRSFTKRSNIFKNAF